MAAALAHHGGAQAALGILPMGTGNLLARNLYIPVSDVAACVNIALNGAGQAVDAIEMTTTSAPGEETEHTFFVMSGAGFDALVMNDTNEDIKAKFGWVAYVQSGMKHMLGRSHPVRISVDGGGASYSADAVGADRELWSPAGWYSPGGYDGCE